MAGTRSSHIDRVVMRANCHLWGWILAAVGHGRTISRRETREQTNVKTYADFPFKLYELLVVVVSFSKHAGGQIRPVKMAFHAVLIDGSPVT